MTGSVLSYNKIEYPYEDGLPMAESDFQRDDLLDAVKVLGIYFQNRSDVYVSGNLFIFYEEDNPGMVVSPDVFVIFGVEKRKRLSYKTWEEGDKAPDFVLEITSKSTRSQDLGSKKGVYAFLGVRDYFQYDPTGDYLNPRLQGLRLVDGNYLPVPVTVLPDGTRSLWSEVLELELRLLPNGNLRFYNPITGEYLLTPQEAQQALEETEQALEETEQALEETEQALREAEERSRRLADKLRELGIDPDAL